MISFRELQDRGLSIGSNLLHKLKKNTTAIQKHLREPEVHHRGSSGAVLHGYPDGTEIRSVITENPGTDPLIHYDTRQSVVLSTPLRPDKCNSSPIERNDSLSGSPVELIPVYPNDGVIPESSVVHFQLQMPDLPAFTTLQKDDLLGSSNKVDQSSSGQTKNEWRRTAKNIYGFCIEDVLLASSSTKPIITKKTDENRFILRSDRQAIAAVLIDHVIEKLGTSPSKEALEQLAKHLVLVYPNLGDCRRSEFGWQMWFFHTMKGQGATGFLEDRLKNQRKRLGKDKLGNRPSLVEIDKLNWTSENEDDDPVPDQSQLEYLKHNFGSEVPTRMKSTVFMRRSLLRVFGTQKLDGLVKAMQAMPRLFDTKDMIIQDFNIRHPSIALVLYDRWPKVSKLLFEYAEDSGICYKKKLDVSKQRYDLSDDDIAILAFCLLPFILPSCGRKLTDKGTCDDTEDDIAIRSGKRGKQASGSRKRPCSVKASDLESLRSMIQFRSQNTHVSEVLSENRRMAPFILALGSTSSLEFNNFFVVISKVAVPCGSSFIVALDTCFKCFTVLYWPLPIESFDHWLFIQHGVFGKPYQETEVPPVVQALIGQIMCRI